MTFFTAIIKINFTELKFYFTFEYHILFEPSFVLLLVVLHNYKHLCIYSDFIVYICLENIKFINRKLYFFMPGDIIAR